MIKCLKILKKDLKVYKFKKLGLKFFNRDNQID